MDNKYLKMLKENKIFDFENNNVSIKDVIIDPKNKSYKLNLVINNSLKYNEYMSFLQNNYNLFKSKDIKLIIDISYINITLEEQNYIEYFDNIITTLCLDNPNVSVLKTFKREFKDDTFIIYVDIVDIYKQYLEMLKLEFFNCGLDVFFELVKDDNLKSIDELKEEIENKDLDNLRKMKENIAVEENKKNIVIKNQKTNYRAVGKTAIKDLPLTNQDISTYMNTQDQNGFLIEAEIFHIEIKSLKTSTLATLKVTDNTDSIVVKKWIRSDKEIDDMSELKPGDILSITGKATYDSFSHDVVLMADKISYVGKKAETIITEKNSKKRVELHAHTKMSNIDAIASASDYINMAINLGHKAVAITDHNGVYAFPEMHKHKVPEDFKLIYGAEMNYVNDGKDFAITYGNADYELKQATYVVFDIETTGLSQKYDRIIEIAAVKVYQGGIIDSFSCFVNPEMLISEKITKITSITNDMVKDSKTINEILPEFLEFCKGSILVAHNASFDVGMIYSNFKRLNIEYNELPVIDTLNIMRALYNDQLSRFNLKAMSKFFKVKQEHHHRAIDDTKVTAECFLYILQEIYKRDVFYFNDINNLIPENMWRFVIPKHINILVKNQSGLKNLYRLVSDALTNHCGSDARLLKSVLEKCREGLLISSGCINNPVFQNAMYRSQEELEEEIKYYDIIEVQPPMAYSHLFNDVTGGETAVKEVIRNIIETAKKFGKIVVATSDCHYLTQDLKKYRDILIATKFAGSLHSLAFYNTSPHMHFRTTDEMLDEFRFLGDEQLIEEIVIDNTNVVASMIDKITVFTKEMLGPRDDEFKDSLNIPSIAEEVRRLVASNVKKTYGDNPPTLVSSRVKRELDCIINNGFASVYYMSHLLVKKSLEEGYLVGSRGSVGSSLVATMMDITEVNPLSPHFRCKKCCFSAFKMNEDEKKLYANELTEDQIKFMSVLDTVGSGFDLPDADCPVCGNRLSKDGHDIPFETFLGFDGDKVPDIDLNFSGEYQPIAHEFVRELLGSERAFRGGTVATIREKNGFGYVKGYMEQKNITLRSVEIERWAAKLDGIKRSTGQHPGGIIVVPSYAEIYDVTPVQYPADNSDNAWRTTHFDYHSFESNLLKLDILGHDDPTMIRFLMDYVKEHPTKYPFTEAIDIPIDDKNVYRLFSGTDVIGVTPEQISSSVASYAIPELGTNFVREMLKDTMPKTFSGLVKISGLSHGTDVWLGNAKSLVNGEKDFGKVEFDEVIGCRDDIMVYLMYQGVEPLKAFQIMEFVRRGNPTKPAHREKWEQYKTDLRQKGVKEWYIWSCEQIKYMFPKAHAAAYVLMAMRIAWFKVYSPLLFYSAYFSKRSKAHHVKAFVEGSEAIKEEIRIIQEKKVTTAKEEDLLTSLFVALEMTSRGLKFLPLDINKSDASIYIIEDNALRIPFIAFDGLGENVAIDVIEKRKEKEFTSREDIKHRTKINKTLLEEFEKMGILDNLPKEEDDDNVGIFAFADI